jgi:heme/copper-type cytochrome/quinol oxidase subunit 2
MGAKVRVVDPEDYQTWVERQKQLIDEGRKLAQEQRKQFDADTTPTPTS